NPETGFLVNLKQLSHLLKEKVVDKLDHKNMNTEVDFMQGRFASTESLAIAIWEQIKQPIKEMGAELHCIKISETENNFVEYYG
ncbi:MAG: 6-carboxytetrahydropterin synthase, partial [Bacteroidales bacterium]|nr:6-carboxytetrahydropterin synthase [Bacteroidales bacterium]